MTTSAVLAIRLEKKLGDRVKVDVDLQGTVSVLREHVSKTIKCPAEDIDLVYLGVALDDKKTLDSYFFKSGRTIHVLKKIKPKEQAPQKDTKSLDACVKFIKAMYDYGHKNVVQKLDVKLLLKKLLASVPNLSHDMGAVSLLRDAELLVTLGKMEPLRKIIAAHRVIVEVLPHITSYLRENPVTPTTNQASTSSGNTYSLEALSDDDEMENNPAPSARESQPLQRNPSSMAITAAQLSAALENARNFTSTDANSADNSTPAPGAAARPIITNEMFGNALQQAFASATAAAGTSATTASAATTSSVVEVVTDPALPAREAAAEESLESLRTRLQPQLQQMREMGLLDETQNIRALRITAGDVQAAVEMVFGSDIDMNF